jgi:4-amino-4-deoxy-L-arabinose transferase-like glycosyltransferase
VWLAAALLLAAMFLLLLCSVREDALTYDENPHITAGYAYLRFRDARLNAEHPPLLKMLAAAPLLPLPLHFPLTHPAWQDDLDRQWTLARVFLYESGNDPHRIAARARLAPIVLTVTLGLVLFLWARRWAGDGTALLALFLYAFSPTVLAHGRYVTTDVPAAFGVALAGFSFTRFLAVPSRPAALAAGLALGTALLCKFSTVLLVPLLAALACLWLVLEPTRRTRYLAGLGIIGVSAALLVLLPYLWMTAQYPPEQQLQDTYFRAHRAYFRSWDGEPAPADFARLAQDRTRDLRACAHGLRPLRQCPADLAIFLADKPIVRAWVQYLMGLAQVVLHVRAGHITPTYFLGEVSERGRWSYFPVVYAIKEPLPFHLLTALALFLALARVGSSAWGVRPLLRWLRSHPAETLMLSWLALYWGVALQANVNMGVRHLLPAFPFTILLVAREVGQWRGGVQDPCRHTRILSVIKRGTVALLLLWQCVSVLRTYPSFLAYFNEAVGGPEGGMNYTVDSDLDWGQDLRRLRAFVDTHRIDRIAVDYFGTSPPRYELGQRYLPWRSALGPYQGWLAVSAYALQTAQGRRNAPEQTYAWLRGITPVAKVGHSIFVYDLRDIRPAEELAVTPAH